MTASPVLVFIHLLAACLWIGGFVAIVVVARTAQREFAPPTRVAFFRTLGRAYGKVAGAALAVSLASGAVLPAERGWDGTAVAAAVVVGALVIMTIAGVAQARGRTRLRQRALSEDEGEDLSARVRRGARWAAVLRAAIGALTLALLALGARPGRLTARSRRQASPDLLPAASMLAAPGAAPWLTAGRDAGRRVVCARYRAPRRPA